MSLLNAIPGLKSHLAAVPDPAPKVEPVKVEPVGLPHHWLMVSRHGRDYVLAGCDEDVAVLVPAYPELAVVGPAEVSALRGHGQEEADWLLSLLTVNPGARVQSIKRKGELVGERSNLRVVK